MKSKLRPVVATVMSTGLALAAPLAAAQSGAERPGAPVQLAQKSPCGANPCAANMDAKKKPTKAAAKKNPGAAKNPCAAANPCAAKNPCGAKKM